jgi:hypothetical protein
MERHCVVYRVQGTPSVIHHQQMHCPCQRHTLRYRRPSTTACPACWVIRTFKELNYCKAGKTYFVLSRLEQPRQNKNLLYRHYMPLPNEPTREGPLLSVLFEPPFPSVSNSEQGPPLSSLSGPLTLSPPSDVIS